MKKSIRIEGMNCGHCTATVEKALRAVNGVSSANVDLKSKKATVESADSVCDESLKKAIVDAGFEVLGIE